MIKSMNSSDQCQGKVVKCNDQQKNFDLNAILLAAQADNTIAKHCDNYDIAMLQDDDFKNAEWQLTPFNKSMMAGIPLFTLLKPDDLIVFELSDPDADPDFRFEGFWTIVFSNDSPPSLFCTQSYLPEEGFDFTNYSLTSAQSLTESLPSRAIKTLEAFRLFIIASTKLSDAERKMWLSRADTELTTISHYISNYLATPCSPKRLSADVQLIIDYYFENFFDYWKVIEDHKVTDFNFTTEK